MTESNEAQEEQKNKEAVRYRTYALGWDFGNRDMKAALLKGRNPLTKTLPTAIAKVNYRALKNMEVDLADSLVVQLEGENSEWGYGAVALDSRDVYNGMGDLTRYASKYSRIGVLGFSASLIPDKEYGLLITAGLPAEPYQALPDLRKTIKKALTGTYKFSIDGGITWRIAHLEYNFTLMEGAAALLGVPKQGTSDLSAVIDIGGRTTDLYVARSGKPVVALCTGKPIGVVTAQESFASAFREKYGFEVTELELRQITFAYTSQEKKKEYPPISNFGQKVSAMELERLMGEAVAEVGDGILSFIRQTWRESDRTLNLAARFDPVLCIGGGEGLFFEVLKRSIRHLQKTPNPGTANALGYARASQKKLDDRAKTAGLQEFSQEFEAAKQFAAGHEPVIE